MDVIYIKRECMNLQFYTIQLREVDKFLILQVLEDKPDQSRWLLKYSVLGRNVEFSWMARNLQVERKEVMLPVFVCQ